MNSIHQAFAREGLVRPSDRKIGGVCAAIARRFELDPVLVRVLTVLSILLPGPQVVAYLALWVVMPDEDTAAAAGFPGGAPHTPPAPSAA
jgi:phage shock protein PspC (stress-responsive transcriptional regulator)